MAAFRKVLAGNPGMIDAWETLGYTLIRLGRTREGIDGRRPRAPPRPAAHHRAPGPRQGLCPRRAGRPRAEARGESPPSSDPAAGNEALAQLDDGPRRRRRAPSPTRARSVGRRPGADHEPFHPGGWPRSGRAAARKRSASSGAAEEAKRRQRRVVVTNLHANMADCLARLGREAEAEREFRPSCRRSRTPRRRGVGLAMLYRSQGRDAEARAALRRPHRVARPSVPGPEAYLKVVADVPCDRGNGGGAGHRAARARAGSFPPIGASVRNERTRGRSRDGTARRSPRRPPPRRPRPRAVQTSARRGPMASARFRRSSPSCAPSFQDEGVAGEAQRPRMAGRPLERAARGLAGRRGIAQGR